MWCDYKFSSTFIAIGACTLSTFILYKLYKKRKQINLRNQWSSVGKDVVVLHQIQRGKVCPNASPFALKVETFLRLGKIKYVVDNKEPMSKKGKCPWITLNGEDVADSEFVIKKLTTHFDLKIDASLSDLEKANLEAARIMVDEHLLWCYAYWRYTVNKAAALLKVHDFGWYLGFYIGRFANKEMKRRADVQGIGRHTDEEILSFGKNDCWVLSTLLGKSDYFGGDAPSTADCAIFGMLAQFMWNSEGSDYEVFVKEKYKNLGDYCLRMKQKLFPDWNELLA